MLTAKFSKGLPYSLNFKCLNRITLKCCTDDDNRTPAEFKLLDLFQELKDTNEIDLDIIVPYEKPFKYKGQAYRFNENSYSNRLLLVLLRLLKKGIDLPLATDWYYYETSSCMEEPNELHCFFIAVDDDIIEEGVHIFDSLESEIPDDLFERLNDRIESELWGGDNIKRLAGSRIMYDKFYSDTKTGQLLRVVEQIKAEDEQKDAPRHLEQMYKELRALNTRAALIFLILFILSLVIIFK